MTPDSPTQAPRPSRFRATLVRVLIVQAVALMALGAVQILYNT